MMRASIIGLALSFAAVPLHAQEIGGGFDFGGLNPELGQPDVQAEPLRALTGAGVQLKGLDKVSGEVSDIEIAVGDVAVVGRLEVTLAECRYPEDNPTGEAFAWLDIRDTLRDASVFQGWMIASSPALNALDHARYDVWVIRCTSA